MSHTYAIVIGIVKYGDEFLIAKRAATKKFAPSQWEFLSGFIDVPGSAEEIILRELKEEVGMTGVIVRAGDSFVLEDSEGRWVIIPYLVEAKSKKVTVNPNDHSEVRWVSREELARVDDLKAFLANKTIQSLLR